MTSPQIERVDAIPMLIIWLQRMAVAEPIDRHWTPHREWDGLRYGQLAVIFLSFVLHERDHRPPPSRIGSPPIRPRSWRAPAEGRPYNPYSAGAATRAARTTLILPGRPQGPPVRPLFCRGDHKGRPYDPYSAG